MTIKLTTSCSGVDYSFHQDQVVEAVDPAVGTDLVKHGMAVELDADGKPVVVTETADEDPADDSNEGSEQDDVTGENSQEGDSTSDQTEQTEQDEQRNADEFEPAETADVDPAGDTANLPPAGQSATVKPKGETRKK